MGQTKQFGASQRSAIYAPAIAFACLVVAAGFFGGLFRPDAWYAALNKAPWNPPNWVFAPVWTILYIMIGIAGWLVWRGNARDRQIVLWLAALVLNALWTPLFFGAKLAGLALAEMLFLLAAIIGFIFAARPVDRRAAWLFVPYALWVTYATSLTAWVWWNN